MRKRKRASENLKHTVCVCAYVCVFLMVFSFNTLLWFLNREDTHLLRQRVGILDSSGIVASFLNNLPACWQVLALEAQCIRTGGCRSARRSCGRTLSRHCSRRRSTGNRSRSLCSWRRGRVRCSHSSCNRLGAHLGGKDVLGTRKRNMSFCANFIRFLFGFICNLHARRREKGVGMGRERHIHKKSEGEGREKDTHRAKEQESGRESDGTKKRDTHTDRQTEHERAFARVRRK